MRKNIIENAVLFGTGLVLTGCAGAGIKDASNPVPNQTPSDENPAVLQIPNEQIIPPPIYFDLGGGRYYKKGYEVQESEKKCFVWPVYGSLSTYFGETAWYPYFGIDYMIKDRYGHFGIDIDQFGHYGDPVIAPADGIVEKAVFDDFGYGYHIILDHGKELKSLLAHNSKLLVEEGQEVRQGEAIAAVGSTGWSTGPHLHFETWHNNFMVNPLTLLEDAQGECES